MSGISLELFRLFAGYNSWMNEKIYAAAGELSKNQLEEDNGAFFGSVFQTLNHIMFGDRFLLTRVREYLENSSLIESITSQWEFEPKIIYFATLAELREARCELDQTIVNLVGGLTETQLLEIRTISEVTLPMWTTLLHMFNHQTHHRGQITTLLSQYGLDLGMTDINVFYLEITQPRTD